MVLLCLLFFLLCLLFPETTGNGISAGLVLISTQVIPALYPFIFLTTLFKYFNASSGRTVSLPLSMGTAFLSGYPLGAKIVAEQYDESAFIPAQSMLTICNNPSPAYMISYIGLRCFGSPLTGLLMYISILSGNLISGLISVFFFRSDPMPTRNKLKFQSTRSISLILDRVIQDTFTTVVTVSSYILVASVAAAFINQISILPPVMKALGAAFLEMTTGIGILSPLPLPINFKILLMIPILSFGGLSVIAQTASMIRNTHLSIKKYMAVKALSIAAALTIMYLLIHIFKY